jgi:uncharacterized protein YlxW (UPF0749 family)
MGGVLALLAGALTFWLVQQWRLETLLQQTAAAREARTLTVLVQQSLRQDASLTAQVAAARAAAAAVGNGPPETARRQLGRARAAAGLTGVSGGGVIVTLRDAAKPSFPGEPAQLELVHDQYVLHIVALLVGAGARAVSIAGQRYVSTTAIYCAGPTISVNGVTYGTPFVIDAVGPADRMLGALAADPDVQGWSQLVSIHFRTAAALAIPPLRQPPALPWLSAATTPPH